MKIKIIVALLVLAALNLTFFGIKYIQIERNIEKYDDSSKQDNPSVVTNSVYVESKQKPITDAPSDNIKEKLADTVESSINVKKLISEKPLPVKTSVDTVKKPKGKVAIIIDDIGIKTFRYFMLDQIPYNLNLAVIPGLKDSKELVKQYADNKKYQLLLHMPMAISLKNKDKESNDLITMKYQYMIRDGQKDKEIRKVLTEALNSIDGYGIILGLNNHMGSSITASKNMMESVIKWADKNKLYFVDSMTTAKSVGYEVAKKKRIRTGYNEVFLDETDTPEDIRESLEKAKNLAIKNGTVLVIAHIQRQNTLEVLFTEMPKMASAGIKFVFVSDIL